MTLPKGWKEETPEDPITDLHLYDENTVWELVTKAITRVLYDAIATHEAHGLNYIPVDWLRDYCDDIAINFPRQNIEINNSNEE